MKIRRRLLLRAASRALTLGLAMGGIGASPLALRSQAVPQMVRGIVRDSGTGSPISGAVASLLDPAGHALVRTLTDQGGRFTLRASSAAVTLQILHIGHLPRELPLAGLGQGGAATIDIAMGRVPVRLDAIRAAIDTVAPLCPRPPDGGVGWALWDQARDEFLAAIVARVATTGMIRLLSYERTIDPASGRVIRQSTAISEGPSSNPSFAARSAAAFMKDGFIDTVAHGLVYGPDVDVLLDEAFALSHCFQLQRGDAAHRGETGVSFVPMRNRYLVADIAGVLWLDSSEHSIRTLEYRYTNVSQVVIGALGGILTFRTLPNGVPVVEHWIIRTSPFVLEAHPSATIAPVPRDPPAGGVATTETGAELIQATWPDSVRWSATLGTVVGQVHTPQGSPAPNSMNVTLVGTDYPTVASDSNGKFLMTGVLPGRYTVTVADPLLAAFRLPSDARDASVDVVRDSSVRLELVSSKPRADVLAGVCGHPPPQGTGDLLLRVVSRDGSALQVGRLDVDTVAMLAGARSEPVRTVQVKGTGSFVTCGVPWDVDLKIHVRVAKDSVEREARIPANVLLDTLTILVKGGGTP